MNNKRYFVAGLFIILTTIAMIFIGFWLAFGLKDVKYNTYITKFHESVTGLNENAAVNYNGVNIGKVESIRIDKQNPSTVLVKIQIQEGIPIYTNTYASLVPQGITGQVFITLSLSSKEKQVLIPPKDKAPFPEIQTKPSFLTNIVNQMSLVTEHVTDVSNRVNQIISKGTVTKINKIVSNLETISSSIANSSQDIHQSLSSLNIILKNTAKSSKNLDSIMHNIDTASKSIATASVDISQLIVSIQNQTLPGINNVILPQLSQTLGNINQTSSELNMLIDTLNQNPSVLIRGKAQNSSKYGVNL